MGILISLVFIFRTSLTKKKIRWYTVTCLFIVSSTQENRIDGVMGRSWVRALVVSNQTL